MVTWRSRSSSAVLLPYAARTWKVSVEASYSMIDPPSVPVRRTALPTTRCSTSSRSRLELTASPTSDSASSWSILAASSRPRCARARASSTWRRTMVAWVANDSSRAIARASKGATSARHRVSVPTTSSSKRSGAARVVRKPNSRDRSRRP